MPLRLPASSDTPDSPDTSRRWLWLALFTGLLALLLAGSAVVQRPGPGPEPTGHRHSPAEEGTVPTARHLVIY